GHADGDGVAARTADKIDRTTTERAEEVGHAVALAEIDVDVAAEGARCGREEAVGLSRNIQAAQERETAADRKWGPVHAQFLDDRRIDIGAQVDVDILANGPAVEEDLVRRGVAQVSEVAADGGEAAHRAGKIAGHQLAAYVLGKIAAHGQVAGMIHMV